jgi:hypothetical protein
LFNPDSAVAFEVKSEEQTLRSEANGPVPPSGHRSSVVDEEPYTHNEGVRKSENAFETERLGVFATPGLLLAHARR